MRLTTFALVASLQAAAALVMPRDTGCDMTPDSVLMQCLGDFASIPPSAPTGDAIQSQSAYYCQVYEQIAACWAQGLYCREWLPFQIAADKLCHVATATSTIPTSVFTSVVAEASAALTSVWNNDSGTDIPVLSDDLNTGSTRPTWTHVPGSSTFTTTDAAGSTVVTATPTSTVTERRGTDQTSGGGSSDSSTSASRASGGASTSTVPRYSIGAAQGGAPPFTFTGLVAIVVSLLVALVVV